MASTSTTTADPVQQQPRESDPKSKDHPFNDPSSAAQITLSDMVDLRYQDLRKQQYDEVLAYVLIEARKAERYLKDVMEKEKLIKRYERIIGLIVDSASDKTAPASQDSSSPSAAGVKNAPSPSSENDKGKDKDKGKQRDTAFEEPEPMDLDKLDSVAKSLPPFPAAALKAILEAEARAERAEKAKTELEARVHQIYGNYRKLHEHLEYLEKKAQEARNAFSRFAAPDAALRQDLLIPPDDSILARLSMSFKTDGLKSPPRYPQALATPHSDMPNHYNKYAVYTDNDVTISLSSSVPDPPRTSKRRAPLAQAATERSLSVRGAGSAAGPSSTTSANLAQGAHHNAHHTHHANSSFQGIPLPPPPSATAPPPNSSSSGAIGPIAPAIPAKRQRSSRAAANANNSAANLGPPGPAGVDEWGDGNGSNKRGRYVPSNAAANAGGVGAVDDEYLGYGHSQHSSHSHSHVSPPYSGTGHHTPQPIAPAPSSSYSSRSIPPAVASSNNGVPERAGSYTHHASGAYARGGSGNGSGNNAAEYDRGGNHMNGATFSSASSVARRGANDRYDDRSGRGGARDRGTEREREMYALEQQSRERNNTFDGPPHTSNSTYAHHPHSHTTHPPTAHGNSPYRSSHHRSSGDRDRDRGTRHRSASRSSAGSSWSIDEMLLEAADQRGGGGNANNVGNNGGATSPHDTRGDYQRSMYTSGAGGGSTRDYSSRDGRQRDSVNVSEVRAEVGPHREPPSLQTYQTHIFAPPVTGAPAKKNKTVPANQLVTLGPGGVVVSGGGSATAPPATTLPGGGYPPTNSLGQRICRQCGMAGRYKDGKCVEKWGPGPEGPGTVCDRCRKKMKRVERRGTIDQAAAMLQQSQAQTQAAAAGASVGVHHTSSVSAAGSISGHPIRPSPPQRQDTIIAEESQRSDRGNTQMLSPQSTRHSHIGHAGHHARQSDSRSRSPVPDAHRGYPQGSGSTAPPTSGSGRPPPSHRRPPTPPYITSLSTRDQERGPYPSPAGGANGTPNAGSASRSSSMGEEHDDLLALAEGDGDGDGERDEIDADVDGDLDVDAEIARTLPSGTPPNSKQHHPHQQNGGSPVKILVNGSNTSGSTTGRGGNSASYANGNGVTHHGYGLGRDPVHDKLPSSRTATATATNTDTFMDIDGEEADADAEADPDADIIDAVDAATSNGRLKEED